MATQRVAKKTKAVRKPTRVVKKPALRARQASRTPAARTAARAATIDDYEGARQVLSRYCHALDQGKLGEVGALFHRNAVFSVSFEGQKHTGREAGAVKDRRWLKYRRTEVLAGARSASSRERYQTLIDRENNLRRW